MRVLFANNNWLKLCGVVMPFLLAAPLNSEVTSSLGSTAFFGPGWPGQLHEYQQTFTFPRPISPADIGTAVFSITGTIEMFVGQHNSLPPSTCSSIIGGNGFTTVKAAAYTMTVGGQSFVLDEILIFETWPGMGLPGGVWSQGGTQQVDVTSLLRSLVQSPITSVTLTIAFTGEPCNLNTFKVQGESLTIYAPVAPPGIAKEFVDSDIQLLGGSDTTQLIIRIQNPPTNTVSLTGIAFTDTLPSGLIISTPNALSTSCPGTVTALAGTNVISLSGATLAPGNICSIVVNVTGTEIGVQTNTTGPVSAIANEVTINGNTATASVSVTDLFFLWFFFESGGGNGRP